MATSLRRSGDSGPSQTLADQLTWLKAKPKPWVSLGGSIKDDESIAAANEDGIAMAFTGIRHFKH
jgi:hypothetical protein